MGIQKQLMFYRSCTPVVDTWYESGSERTIAEVIVEALAEAEGCEESDIEPLYGTIDLGALSELLESCDSTERNTMVSFSYRNCNVFIRADGRIRVCDSTQRTEPKPVFEGRPA